MPYLFVPVAMSIVYFGVGAGLFALVPSFKRHIPWRPYRGIMTAGFWKTASWARTVLLVAAGFILIDTVGAMGNSERRGILSIYALGFVSVFVLPAFAAWEWLYNVQAGFGAPRNRVLILWLSATLLWAVVVTALVLIGSA